MKLKIINKKQFLKGIVFSILFIIAIIFVISTNSLSYGEVQYRKLYVAPGDTVWEIAKEEKRSNKYFETKQIREIVSEINAINHIENRTLKVGEELQIPYID